LSLAEVHSLHPEDIERRKLLVIAVLLGDSGTRALKTALERTGPHWARKIVAAIPMRTVSNLNKVLGPRFITKYGTKQGVLVLSKQVPRGIGALPGADGNYAFGRLTVASARSIFGPPRLPLEHYDAHARAAACPVTAKQAQDTKSVPRREPHRSAIRAPEPRLAVKDLIHAERRHCAHRRRTKVGHPE
jgi:hypothetical protein